MPLRCFLFGVTSVCEDRLISCFYRYFVNVLHNKCSSSVKIDCTIRICSSTVERRRGIIRRQERPTRPRSTKNENCEYNFSLKCILVNSPGEEVIVLLLFRFIFSFVRALYVSIGRLKIAHCAQLIYIQVAQLSSRAPGEGPWRSMVRVHPPLQKILFIFPKF